MAYSNNYRCYGATGDAKYSAKPVRKSPRSESHPALSPGPQGADAIAKTDVPPAGGRGSG